MESKHWLTILKILLIGERMNMGQIKRAVGVKSHAGIKRAVDELEDAGLVITEMKPVSPLTRWVWLTEKGEIVAEKARELLDLLEQG